MTLFTPESYDLSLKGVARVYRGIVCTPAHGFSVVKDIFGVSKISGSVSLRSQLELLAQKNYEYEYDYHCHFKAQVPNLNAGFGVPTSDKQYWQTFTRSFTGIACYTQTWTHIKVVIALWPEIGISDTTIDNCINLWEGYIRGIWNNKWGCAYQGELACRLSFRVEFIKFGFIAHHIVYVLKGSGQSHELEWYEEATGGTAAHEFGHMIGLKDEYLPQPCTEGMAPIDTGTVMDDDSDNVPARMMERFAANIDSNVVSI